ncbi:MAG: RluA family pseudouridine synthase [Ruminococcus sp.]|nr:RluA family pseudouridine synthase [Ruminococcus sp.]
MAVEIIIKEKDNGKKLGEVLLQRGVSRRLITRLKRTPNGITRNGEIIRTIDTVSNGDVIILNEQDNTLLEPNPSLDVEILFDDDQLVVFNKPPFMPVHPSIKHQGDTLGNYFAALYPKLTFRPVNRLDRDTSGCVIVAKNQFAAKALQRSYKKVYYAICHGRFTDKTGSVNAPIAREKESIIKRCVRDDGQVAITHYKVLDESDKYSIVEFTLESGRTHQIRVHMAHIGHAVAGDDMYGGTRDDYKRQALHCGVVSFIHPTTNDEITVKAPFELCLK